jgi:NAD(P)-dependent dehydrogenase (short-subunit alcohol dehydrogenase family)
MTPLEIPLFVNKTNVFEDLTNREFQLFNENGSVGVPMGRTGFAREITPAVLFLSDPRQSAYMTGSTMTIDGGYTASPVI